MQVSSASSRPGQVKRATFLGLALALFGVLVARQLVKQIFPTLTISAAICKELLIWLCAVALLIVIWRGERLSLKSVGIGTFSVKKSLLWSVPLTLICFVIAAFLSIVTHFNGGKSGEAMSKLPLWVTTLIVLRAGIVEEFFYRGYAIGRLELLGLSRYAAAAIPLVIFGVAHWTGGWANIVIALALGVVLSAFYLWRRDLVANMIAHFLVDFIANIVPKLFS
jgi:membrane protease YdiL (CAAX protease family)